MACFLVHLGNMRCFGQLILIDKEVNVKRVVTL